jgi:uncharacterized membrane protein
MMKGETLWAKISHKLRDIFLRGVLVVMPIGITIWIIQFFYQVINGPSDQVIRWLIKNEWLPGWEYFRENHDGTIPGAGFWVTLIFILLVGVAVSNILGRSLVRAVDELFMRIPLVKNVYQALKQTMVAVQDMRGDGKTVKFNQMVLVPWGNSTIYFAGFVTGRLTLSDGKSYCSVFMPNSPTPVTGFTVLVREEDLIWNHGLSVEEGLKFVISYGLAVPRVTDDERKLVSN